MENIMKCEKCGNKLFSEFSYDAPSARLLLRKRCSFCNEISNEETIENYYNFNLRIIEEELTRVDNE